jgi:hypothetical protein
MNTNSSRLIFFSLIWIALALVLPDSTFAHCDGLDGPVVKAAQKALETGNFNLCSYLGTKEG